MPLRCPCGTGDNFITSVGTAEVRLRSVTGAFDVSRASASACFGQFTLRAPPTASNPLRAGCPLIQPPQSTRSAQCTCGIGRAQKKRHLDARLQNLLNPVPSVAAPVFGPSLVDDVDDLDWIDALSPPPPPPPPPAPIQVFPVPTRKPGLPTKAWDNLPYFPCRPQNRILPCPINFLKLYRALFERSCDAITTAIAAALHTVRP
ncbi:hypothetical protein B0H14DRAFT_3434729 [Mycena olivaceomarginata]|nr:hypothetical protein B0H14DRAFT_3434729 [Mycena olivaceomarginata]